MLDTKLLPILFCSLAILDPRVGHTVDIVSPFIPVLCHSKPNNFSNNCVISVILSLYTWLTVLTFLIKLAIFVNAYDREICGHDLHAFILALESQHILKNTVMVEERMSPGHRLGSSLVWHSNSIQLINIPCHLSQKVLFWDKWQKSAKGVGETG